MAEGEGFEPPKVFSLSGFQDRRDRPLCHPSGSHPFLSKHLLERFLRRSFKRLPDSFKKLARREGIEPPTNGFGDRYSAN